MSSGKGGAAKEGMQAQTARSSPRRGGSTSPVRRKSSGGSNRAEDAPDFPDMTQRTEQEQFHEMLSGMPYRPFRSAPDLRKRHEKEHMAAAITARGRRRLTGKSLGPDYRVPDPPATDVLNRPSFALEFETVRPEEELPPGLGYDESVMRPPLSALGPIYGSEREASRKTGWIKCSLFLGEGGFGQVFLGKRYQDRHSDKPFGELDLCAVKQVPINAMTFDGKASNCADDSVAMEAYCLRAFGHVNIVRFIDCYSVPAKGFFYYLMEYADRHDLRREIYHAHLPVKHLWGSYARNLFRGICNGIGYMHVRGIAHQDLKPDNILLKASADRSSVIPKIADFGLAVVFKGKVMPPDGRRERIKGTSCEGMLQYKAPEVLVIAYNLTAENMHFLDYHAPIPQSEDDRAMGLTDNRPPGPRRPITFYPEYSTHKFDPDVADVYSLGVILFEMLAGERPYLEATWTDSHLLEHIFRLEPLRCRSKLSPHAFDFICQMLEPDVHRRLTMEGILTHAWMKRPTSGPNDPKGRHPEPKFLDYVSPTPSPSVSVPHPPHPPLPLSSGRGSPHTPVNPSPFMSAPLESVDVAPPLASHSSSGEPGQESRSRAKRRKN